MILVDSGVDRAALVLDAVVGAYGQAPQALCLVVLHGAGVGERGGVRVGAEGVMPALCGCLAVSGGGDEVIMEAVDLEVARRRRGREVLFCHGSVVPLRSGRPRSHHI